jgi:metal-dependent amidase/aminoacylase/carboxypeptidase family protein
VISVCMMRAGETDNVIPDTAELRGTIRTLSSAVLSELQRQMKQMCDGLAAAYGTSIAVEFFQGYPATVNSPAETALCEMVIRETFGDASTHANVAPNMTSEDFGFMLEERPGSYVLIGNTPHARTAAGLHHPSYDFNDEITPAGVRYWVMLAQAFFSRR